MSGDAEYPQQISSSDDRRRSRRIRFPVGSPVEVRTDEKGLVGVYFSATVIRPPPPSTTISARKKSRRLVYVEFDNLLADEDASQRLREYVDVPFVRPAPPPLRQEAGVDRGFELDDVVDAFHKDGWWMGVVSRVVEGGKSMVVTFQNPPDELEFGLAELRAHWDWVNGNCWVKQESVRFVESMFGVGRHVEVSFDQGYYQDAWIGETIEQDLGNGVFLVEYYIHWDEAAKVDSDRIRPCPPRLVEDKKKPFLLEKVDARFDYAWWSGVITKELENSRYVVFFKQMKQDKEFELWQLRPHMEWEDGKWLLPSISDDGVEDEDSAADSAVDGKALSSLTSRKQLTPPNDQSKSSNKRRRQFASDSGIALAKLKQGNVVQDRRDKPTEQVLCGGVNDIETSAPSETMGHRTSQKEKIVRKQRSGPAKQNVVRVKIQRTTRSISGKTAVQVQSSLGGKTVQVDCADKEFDDIPLARCIEQMRLSQSLIDGSRPSPVGNMEQCTSNGEKRGDVVALDDEDSGRQSASAMVDMGSTVSNKPQSLLLPRVQKKVGVLLLDKDREKQQPGSGMQADWPLADKCCLVPSELHPLPCAENTVVIVLDENSEEEPENGTRAASALAGKGSILPSESQSSPFVEGTSSIWKTIESMRVFQKIPQKPHFQPLEHVKESLREGLAMGYMVAFANLVEKACRLQLSDTKSIIDDMMETLPDLERHGFDVSLVRRRLTKFLSLKVQQEKLVDEVNNCINHISERNHSKTMTEEEIQEINVQMRKLQEKLSLAESAKEKDEHEIASLQARLKQLEESIKIMEYDFESIASSIL